MKKKTKILIALCLIFSFTMAFALVSFAGESSVENSDTSPVDNVAEESVFDLIYSFAVENADKIFSLLAFVGAILLSFAYKKGLFPFVQKTLSSLSGVIKALKEETEKSNSENSQFIENLSKKLASSEEILRSSLEKITELEAELKEAARLGDKTQEFRAVIEAEVEMIHEIFASSSLPQYEKDRAHEAYTKMKRTLDGGGE